MKHLSTSSLAFLLGCGCIAAGQTPNNTECIEALWIPAYSNVAMKEPRGGVMNADVIVGENGRPASTRLSSASEHLKAEVSIALKHMTLSRKCHGRSISLRFTFKLEGEPVVNPVTKVIFHGPNHFELRSAPLALIAH
jgi:hypothetical protein